MNSFSFNLMWKLDGFLNLSNCSQQNKIYGLKMFIPAEETKVTK